MMSSDSPNSQCGFRVEWEVRRGANRFDDDVVGVVVSHRYILFRDVWHVQEQSVVFADDIAEIAFELFDARADLAHLGDKLRRLFLRPAQATANFVATSAQGVLSRR